MVRSAGIGCGSTSEPRPRREVEEGAAEAVGALKHLDEVESGRVVRRLTEVRDLLGGINTTSVRESADALSEHIERKGKGARA